MSFKMHGKDIKKIPSHSTIWNIINFATLYVLYHHYDSTEGFENSEILLVCETCQI